MRKIIWVAPMLFLFLILVPAASYAQTMEQGKEGKSSSPDQEISSEQEQGWFHCPYCGHKINPMPGHAMGPGMMHRGWGMGPQCGPQAYQEQKPLDMGQAKQMLQNCLNYSGNPNLKLGKIEDNGSVFRADILTKKEGALVDKVVVNKYSGWVHSIY